MTCHDIVNLRLNSHMAVYVRDFFDPDLCSFLLEGTPYGALSPAASSAAAAPSTEVRQTRSARAGWPGLAVVWDDEPESGVYSKPERVRRRVSRWVHNSPDAVTARGAGRWDFRLGSTFPVDIAGIIDPIYRLCTRSARYDGVTKKHLVLKTQQIMIVEPGAVAQPWHQDHGGQAGYFTILVALNDVDNRLQNASMGGTEVLMPLDPPLLCTAMPVLGQAYVFQNQNFKLLQNFLFKTIQHFECVSCIFFVKPKDGF